MTDLPDEPAAVFGPDETAVVAGPVPGGPDRWRRPAPADSLTPTERVVPSWTDPTVRRASDLIGGPLGRHALVGRARIVTPLRVCLAMAILVLICGWLYKSPCIQQAPNGAGGFMLDQSGERPWITGCYNDVVPLYATHGLDHQKLPYTTEFNADGALVPYSEYPVVTGYFAWAVSVVSDHYGRLAKTLGIWVPLDVAGYFTIGAILLGLCYLVAVAATARIARRRPWDTAIMCLSPLLIVHAFTNWDLLPIGLTAAAMFAWSKGRWRPEKPWALGWPLLAGVLLGVGTAAKLYPVLLLGPLLVLCLRSGRMRAWIAAALALAATWAAVNLPVLAAYPTGFNQFFKLNSERVAEWDSVYQLYMSLSGNRVFDPAAGQTSPGLLNGLSLVLFLIAAAAIGWFALSAARRPRFAQLAFLIVAAFLLTNKVWSPQDSLWLVPLVALALPRWRLALAWQFAEAVVWILLMFSFDQDKAKGLSIYPFDGMALVRDALLIAIMVLVVRDVIRPAGDLIRMAGDDDPSGGVLEDAEDRFTLPSLPVLWARRRRRSRTAVDDTAEANIPEPAGVSLPPA